MVGVDGEENISSVEKLAALVRGRKTVTFTIVRLPFKVRPYRLELIAARTWAV